MSYKQQNIDPSHFATNGAHIAAVHSHSGLCAAHHQVIPSAALSVGGSLNAQYLSGLASSKQIGIA